MLLHQIISLSRYVTDADSAWLPKDFIEERVRQTIFQLSPLKAPGTNVMDVIFFQNYWPIIGKNILFVQNVVNKAFILKDLNRTYISLIPKKYNQEKQLTIGRLAYIIFRIK